MTNQPIQASDHQRIAFSDVFQAGFKLGPPARRTAFFLLIEFVAVLQLVELHLKALSNRPHSRIAHPCHAALRYVSLFLKPFEKPNNETLNRHVKSTVSKSI